MPYRGRLRGAPTQFDHAPHHRHSRGLQIHIPNLYMAGASPSSSGSYARAAAPPPPKPPTSASSRRFPSPCWTHEETLALIESYQEKWHSLRRSNLRASHWEDVADSLSRRCLHLPASTPKTSVQCRHKVEKLRKRYRAEKQRSLSHNPSFPPTSSWVYFPKMAAMEHGTDPPPSDDDDGDEDDDDGNHYAGVQAGGNLRNFMANGSGGGIEGLKFQIPKAARSKVAESRDEEMMAPPRHPSLNNAWGLSGSKPRAEEIRRRLEKKRMRKRKREAVGEMVTALRMLTDGFMRTEQMKMDMAKEMEKLRIEMEVKRTEMMLAFQRRMVSSLLNGYVGKEKKNDEPSSPDS